MKIGIGSYALAWSAGVPGYERPASPLTHHELLRIARDYELKLVQYADNMPLIDLSAGDRIRLKEQAREWGIELEAGTRGTDPDHLLAYLELCEDMDIRLLRTLITVPELEEAERSLLQVLPRFERAGVMLGIENHGLHTTKQLAGLFRRLRSDCIGCVLDTVNSFGALEGTEQVIRELAPYIVNLHLKDFDIRRADHQMGFVIFGTPAGSGRLDMANLRRAVADSGRSTNAVLELWPPYEGSVEQTIRTERAWLEASIRYLQAEWK